MNSATTGDFETKNASDVAKHEFDGNPEENRDIVPPFTYNGQSYSENWDANGQAIFNAGCKGSTPPPTTTTTSEQQVTFCDMESATSGKLETKDASEVAKHEFDGNPEENRDIVPPFTLNGKTYSENWDANGQAIFNAGCNGSSGVQLKALALHRAAPLDRRADRPRADRHRRACASSPAASRRASRSDPTERSRRLRYARRRDRPCARRR